MTAVAVQSWTFPLTCFIFVHLVLHHGFSYLQLLAAVSTEPTTQATCKLLVIMMALRGGSTASS